MNVEDINAIDSEAGVVATLVRNPEFYFYAEELLPRHFTDRQNAVLYEAIADLAQRGIRTVDAYNLVNVISNSDSMRNLYGLVDITSIENMISIAPSIWRNTPEEYKLLVDNIMNAALRRDTLKALKKCENVCYSDKTEDFQQEIYETLDDVMLEYASNNEAPLFEEVVDEYWDEIVERQKSGYAGIPFKFPALNQYATLERGELFLFAAEAKAGKSIMLLNCCVDLLKKDQSVLYIDSELNTRLFTARLLSHLSGVEFLRLKSGQYTEDEKQKILNAKEWIKTKKFCHVYMPMFDPNSISVLTRRCCHTMNLDVLIIDYFKASHSNSYDAFESYAELGKFVDLIKNKLCGELGLIGLGAAQLTSTGKVADSAKIGRNASTICLIRDKSPEEIEENPDCGNKKLIVTLNRNGAQMNSDGAEYIDVIFNGNLISYEQAPKQHIPTLPF